MRGILQAKKNNHPEHVFLYRVGPLCDPELVTRELGDGSIVEAWCKSPSSLVLSMWSLDRIRLRESDGDVDGMEWKSWTSKWYVILVPLRSGLFSHYTCSSDSPKIEKIEQCVRNEEEKHRSDSLKAALVVSTTKLEV